MRNTNLFLTLSQFIVKLLHVLATGGRDVVQIVVSSHPRLSFLPAVWIPRSNQPFMERANRFSQGFAKYICTIAHPCKGSCFPRAYLWLGSRAQISRAPSIQNVRAIRACARQIPGSAQHMRGHDLASGVFLCRQETSDGSSWHTHGHENKFLIPSIVLCILLV